SWITYPRAGCCGPMGRDGPIMVELFTRTGVELPVEGAIFGHVLQPGWVIEGGGRSIFFNADLDRAWDVDLSLSNVLNRGQHSDVEIPCGGCCSFIAGLRAEWSYNWMDILQVQNDADLQDVDFTVNFGVRF